MKSKRLFQIFALLVMLLSTTVGNIQHVYAQADQPAAVVVRELTYWNASFAGYVDAQRYEQWPFTLNESHNFVVVVTSAAEGLSPLILLLDGNGNEIAHDVGTLTSNQPAGNYSIQIQPQTGSGFYYMSLWSEDQAQPSVATVVDPASVTVGGTAAVSVNLQGVPADGYTSTEFTCTYNASLAEVSNIVNTSLFGADAVVAVNGPQNGSFIVAVAGSTGNKATASGTAFTFSVKGLQAGQTAIECKARVSKGDNVLTDISSTAASFTINDVVVVSDGTLTGQVHASKPVTLTLYNADSLLIATVSANTDGTFSLTAPAGTYTVTATASGFLSAQGPATLTVAGTTTKPTVNLLAGDIDGNNVIDQYDAMTIGMSYNTALPASADLNSDGVINVLDLELLAANYRKAGALAWQ